MALPRLQQHARRGTGPRARIMPAIAASRRMFTTSEVGRALAGVPVPPGVSKDRGLGHALRRYPALARPRLHPVPACMAHRLLAAAPRRVTLRRPHPHRGSRGTLACSRVTGRPAGATPTGLRRADDHYAYDRHGLTLDTSCDRCCRPATQMRRMRAQRDLELFMPAAA